MRLDGNAVGVVAREKCEPAAFVGVAVEIDSGVCGTWLVFGRRRHVMLCALLLGGGEGRGGGVSTPEYFCFCVETKELSLDWSTVCDVMRCAIGLCPVRGRPCLDREGACLIAGTSGRGVDDKIKIFFGGRSARNKTYTWFCVSIIDTEDYLALALAFDLRLCRVFVCRRVHCPRRWTQEGGGGWL